ncbi:MULTISPECIES: ABC transporter permease [Streptomyces]|uniref:ABC transporter permease n=1 Tax=Streptomyces TaxID=1883 RepID=UPI00017EA74F|nr:MULTISPECIES: ABC transporter permease [Streptomyces]AKL67542.1 sugar ABC transporter permease [Streptomyces sp. Mg1]EDX25034.1 sugar ABC transporter integral membrane protein [Streptomyces sp. Mg1]RPK46719.1 D-allose transport system permease protein AlsC [Streptomyces sp. ADI91-18]WBY21735.1 ABC transporter permease [Streptomyces goshikiensis]WSS00502.1 ABC transporter permease [Streptomyces goshikiensis]
MKKFDKDKVLLAIAGPALALVSAFLLTMIVLAASGVDPIDPLRVMIDQASYEDVQVLIVNQAGIYYLAALAVAIGFRMNLFNIGVDGQYRLAAMISAVVGASVSLPGPLHVALIVLVAMVTGAFWSGIAGVLKAKRGVSEVVSTIMLNAIATALIAWLILPKNLGVQPPGSNDLTTGDIPESGWFPALTIGDGLEVYGFTFVAFALGVVYWFVLNRTRFGFDLRATGASESAAQASGVDAKKMIMTSMLISGAVAGLAGMPLLLGESHTYNLSFPVGIGFTGITIALLGRNSPIGIFFAALLIAFIDKASAGLDTAGYAKEIGTIMQGLIVIAVVVSYELVRRYGIRRQQQKVGQELAAGHALKTDNKEVAA